MLNQQRTLHTLLSRAVLLPLFALLLASTPLRIAAQTWVGGTTTNWSEGDNWLNGTPPAATGASLIFQGTTHLTSNNDSLVTSLNGITFAEDAGSFVLTGTGFTLNGNILNESGVLQTIQNGITLNGSSRTINTGDGAITITQGILAAAGNPTLTKLGSGILTLQGDNQFAGDLRIYQGRVVLDAGAGGDLASGTVWFGYNQDVSPTNHGGVFEIIGAPTGTTTVQLAQLYVGRSAGANQIVVNSNGGTGTTVEFATYTLNSSGANGFPSLNIDLRSAGSAFKAPLSLTHGVARYATVTKTVAATTQTRFATVDEDGFVVQHTATAALPGSGGVHSAHYHTSGSLALTANVQGSTLTLTGAGELTGAYNASIGALLMVEGSGSYTFDNSQITVGGFFVHQYSTNGVLTINANLLGSGTRISGGVFKAGSGTLVLKGSGAEIAGYSDIHEGRLQLDGSLKDAQGIRVREGATLGGSGEVGGGDVWIYSGGNINTGETRYSDVHVYAGGTLDASDGLAITGTLTLYDGATFLVNLSSAQQVLSVMKDPEVTDPVVILSGDLELNLLDDAFSNIITLLTTTGTMTGEFQTVNGVVLGEGNLVSLEYNSQFYDFELIYGSNSVTLHAIPEPTTISLLLGLSAWGTWSWRRRNAASKSQ
jgi:autotransporter-associated beta strand protein